ncbi:hypothetical protein J2795_004066 [Chryseobacterium bernardetii]|jgi:hypothetical protein|uniref:Uncharacterized protein DUF4270 n=3 Tax=Chryseobacterium TaxID=59732 RepID=A0A543E9V3_9FLAO|nr:MULTISPECIES: DUF4270 family protein [Chryseobacterium]MDR6371844.1 hypothetical protein [Chryseobacterium vietnamense]MDR6443332.1 hypothetical protein [Chryseobacterium bernardetii]MDR6460811.1 hypothetical protein [Chryseobacterium vietnamense]TQM18259.1 uncharacterized protein DUF4270 [Chryseobacterium aquifrigidense]
MTHNLKKTFAMLLLAIFGSALLYNCEPDPDSLGEQLFNGDAAQGNEIAYPVIAYNYDNNDSIRSDASRLISGLSESGVTTNVAVLGAFTESQFGMQRASYVTQLRMPTDNFDFNGANPKVDSVVLVVRPPANTASNTYFFESSDSLRTNTYTKTDFPVDGVATEVSIEKKTYPVRKYGKIGGASKSMKINVHEVTTFLDANNDALKRSNASISTGELLGSGVFDGNVSSLSITKKSDNSIVFSGNLGFRMKLSNTDFFQTHILDKKGKPELQDAANFIRYFKGIKISVDETDRYLYQFSPNDLQVIMYYKYDKTDNGTTTRPQATLNFNLGSANAHIGLVEYNRLGTPVKDALSESNPNEGDAKLFVQGMGGPSVVVKIQDETIAKLKDIYTKDKAGIVSAKIRVYLDPSTWKNTGSTEDRKFTLLNNTLNAGKIDYSKLAFTSDLTNGLGLYYFSEKPEPGYYDFVVTKTIKDIVEGKTETVGDATQPIVNKPLIISAGAFAASTTGTLLGVRNTTRAFDMNRIILIGTDKTNTNPKRIQLMVTYGTKK